MSEVNGKYAPKPGMIPGFPINLGGNWFVLAPLGLRLAREFEVKAQAMQKGIEDANGDVHDGLELGVAMIHASLQRNYPDITIDEVRELVDAGNIIEAQQAISGISGLKRVPPGELPPRG